MIGCVGAEVTYTQFLFTYAQRTLQLNREKCTLLVTTFWICFCLFRTLAIFISRLASPRVILTEPSLSFLKFNNLNPSRNIWIYNIFWFVESVISPRVVHQALFYGYLQIFTSHGFLLVYSQLVWVLHIPLRFLLPKSSWQFLENLLRALLLGEQSDGWRFQRLLDTFSSDIVNPCLSLVSGTHRSNKRSNLTIF